MNKKICMVTGANRGIGKAIAIGLAQRGATVVMVCRDRQNGEKAQAEIQAATGNQEIDLMIADLASLRSVRLLAGQYRERYPCLDVLINNAGLVKKQFTRSIDGYETTFAVNHLAPFLLTNLLLNSLRNSADARVINVSSLVHKWGKIDFDDLNGEKNYDMDRAYNQSKLANVLFTYALSRHLRGTTISVNSMEPGMTDTDFGQEYTGFKAFMSKAWKPFLATPENAAETAVYLALSGEVKGINGKHFIKGHAVKSSKDSYDENLAQRLWEVSERLTGLGEVIS
jgi:NAD(P)-dependent dehydrogenase (short-subunit alcohol dehydrogenase family)